MNLKILFIAALAAVACGEGYSKYSVDDFDDSAGDELAVKPDCRQKDHRHYGADDEVEEVIEYVPVVKKRRVQRTKVVPLFPVKTKSYGSSRRTGAKQGNYKGSDVSEDVVARKLRYAEGYGSRKGSQAGYLEQTKVDDYDSPPSIRSSSYSPSSASYGKQYGPSANLGVGSRSIGGYGIQMGYGGASKYTPAASYKSGPSQGYGGYEGSVKSYGVSQSLNKQSVYSSGPSYGGYGGGSQPYGAQSGYMKQNNYGGGYGSQMLGGGLGIYGGVKYPSQGGYNQGISKSAGSYGPKPISSSTYGGYGGNQVRSYGKSTGPIQQSHIDGESHYGLSRQNLGSGINYQGIGGSVAAGYKGPSSYKGGLSNTGSHGYQGLGTGSGLGGYGYEKSGNLGAGGYGSKGLGSSLAGGYGHGSSGLPLGASGGYGLGGSAVTGGYGLGGKGGSLGAGGYGGHGIGGAAGGIKGGYGAGNYGQAGIGSKGGYGLHGLGGSGYASDLSYKGKTSGGGYSPAAKSYGGLGGIKGGGYGQHGIGAAGSGGYQGIGGPASSSYGFQSKDSIPSGGTSYQGIGQNPSSTKGGSSYGKPVEQSGYDDYGIQSEPYVVKEIVKEGVLGSHGVLGRGTGTTGYGFKQDPKSSDAGYGSPGSSYGSQGAGYGSPGAGHGSSGASYGPSGADYGPLGAGYGPSGTGYGSPAAGHGSSGAGYGPSGSSYGPSGASSGPSGAGYGSADGSYKADGGDYGDGAPKPYEFGYEAKDDYGGEHFRKESSDGSGTVKGSYGYRDEHGLYRHVEYEASKEHGFRATVKTNEPGTDNQDPADAHFEVEKTAQGASQY